MSDCIGPACPLYRSTGRSHKRDLTWVDVAQMYEDPRQCLASYLAVWGAEVLASVKPANLIRINNRNFACGRNIYQLWQEHGESFLADSPLQGRVLQESESFILLLLYRPETLQRRLASRTMRTFLQASGYPQQLCLEAALDHLQIRYQQAIADEIGLFLGYPFKDVKGFICKQARPWRGSSLWRIYGPTRRSLQLNDLYRQARSALIARLMGQMSPQQLLQAA